MSSRLTMLAPCLVLAPAISPTSAHSSLAVSNRSTAAS